jgi:membrane protease YdiL (CAAX protease family)
VYLREVEKDAGAARPWAWPTVAVGVLLFTTSAVGEAPLDVRTLARAGGQTALGLLVIALGGAALTRGPIEETLRVGPTRPRASVLEWTSWVLGLLALSVAVDLALDGLGLREGSRLAELESALATLSGGDVVVGLAGIALAPAIAEEIVFRGLVLGVLLARLPAWAAVTLAALIFGAAHFDLAHGAAAAVLGVYLGAMALAAGSVRPGVLAHAVNNGFALLAPSLLSPLLDSEWAQAGGLVVVAGGLIVAVVTIGRRLGGAPTAVP